MESINPGVTHRTASQLQTSKSLIATIASGIEWFFSCLSPERTSLKVILIESPAIVEYLRPYIGCPHGGLIGREDANDEACLQNDVGCVVGSIPHCFGAW